MTDAQFDYEVVDFGDVLSVTATMAESKRADVRVDASPQKIVIEDVRLHITFTVSLPTEISVEDAEAHLVNGVLEVILPKKRPQ